MSQSDLNKIVIFLISLTNINGVRSTVFAGLLALLY